MAIDILGNDASEGDAVAYIRKPYKGNQELKIGTVVSVSPKSILVIDGKYWDNSPYEYRIKEGRFFLYKSKETQ